MFINFSVNNLNMFKFIDFTAADEFLSNKEFIDLICHVFLFTEVVLE